MSRYATAQTYVRPTDGKYDSEASAQDLTPSPEDQDLAKRVEHAMHASSYWDLHVVRISVRTQVVCLSGRVCSYYLKQIAQETALTVAGTHRIRNDLSVVQAF